MKENFNDQGNRYSRQVLFGPIGESGQEKLAGGSAVIIGCGGLGSVLANNLVLDGTDNFPTRYIINRACIERSIPFIYGAVAASFGMVYNVMPGKGICLKCLFREEPSGEDVLNCNTVGIINTAVNIIASIQTTEALKFLTGNSNDMIEGLINIDVWDLSLDIIDIKKDKSNRCPVCSGE